MKKWRLKFSRQKEENVEENESQNNFEVHSSEPPSGQNQKRKYSFFLRLIPHCFYLILIFGLAFIMKHEITLSQQFSKVSLAREAEILSTLNDLTAQLVQIQSSQNQITELKNSVIRLEQNMATEQSLSILAKSTELQQIHIQLQKMRQELKIGRPTNRTHSMPSRKKHFSRKKPPFQVISLDWMAGQPYASVLYRQERYPLRVGETLAGWKLLQVNVDAGFMVCENAQRRRMKVNLSRAMYE